MTVQVNVSMRGQGTLHKVPISALNPSMADEKGKNVFSRKAMVHCLIVAGHT